MKNTKKRNLKRLPQRCFAVLLAMLMLFSCFSVGVSALANGDSVRITGTKDWVQGFYYDFGGNFGTGHYGQHQWLKADGQTAYCVEPTKNLSAGSKTIDEMWAGFTKEQRDLATAAYVYGYNSYFLHEAAQDGKAYLLDDGYYYFEIREDGETVTVSNADNGPFINTPILGSLVITKSDVSDGKLLPNVGFRIRDEKGEIVREGYTDENGVVRFDGLRYGKYTYQEFTADGYKVDDTEYPFEITENEQVISVTMTNEPIPVEIPKTGDVLLIGGSLAAVAVIASAAWITLAGKSRKKQKNAL